ncbi:uncharacterized protein BKCO1_1070002 [Diplodia corticola]|uniref:Uncharacterized protein n=1 Tax=Diplodia corticola TaxID=236234 RepID=A0A1J9QJ27_9PEZI|nr:uncharacterized protein BKCO1_1070002 [Diplodia corticola]OJD28862.1 hypothetical protein BKCO1_1070002 [Diplodia corticola]
MPAPIDAASAPPSPPLPTPSLPPDASVEDYEKAIEIERQKCDKIMEAKAQMMAKYDRAQEACDQAQLALEQHAASKQEEQKQDQQSQQDQQEQQAQTDTPADSSNSSSTTTTPSKPTATTSTTGTITTTHKRSRSNLNPEAPEFTPGYFWSSH